MYIKLYLAALIIFLAFIFYFLWNKSEIIDEMFYSGKIIYFVKFFAAFLLIILGSFFSKYSNENKEPKVYTEKELRRIIESRNKSLKPK